MVIEQIEREAARLVVPQLTMPPMPEMVATWLFGGVAALLLVIAIVVSLRRKDWTPLVLLVVGTLTCYPTEALLGMLSNFTHAQIGAHAAYVAYAHVVPWFMVFVYSLYFGAWYMFAYPRMLSGTMGGSFLWKAFFISTALAYCFEMIPVHFEMWRYFDPQPLYWWKGTMPPNYAFLNSFCIIFGVVFLDKLRAIPLPWRFPVMLVVGPALPVMGHIGAGQPYFWTLNGDVSDALVDLGGLASMATCLLGVWLLIRLCYPPGVVRTV